MPVNLIIRNPLDWDALAIARNANGANRRELSDYVRFLKAQAVWNDLGFFRDFANAKSLNHSFGPNITFTRNSIATYFDSGGTLRTAAANEPRFDHDPATAGNPSRGLLIEEARTNSIRNSQAGGSTNGVIGSGGVLPTNWTASGHNTNGITTEIIGTGAEAGLSYIDIKISGTPTANSEAYINFDAATQVVAANGQTWAASAYISLVAGSTTNALTRLVIFGRLAAAGLVSGQNATIGSDPTSGTLVNRKYSGTLTITSASVERISSSVQIGYTNGQPFNLTLRIAAPQLEQGAFPTSYIPTTSAAATRAADSAVVTPISSFYNQAEGTLFAEWNLVNNVGPRHAVVLSNATDTDRLLIQIRNTAAATTRHLAFINSSAVVTTLDFSNVQSGVSKSAFAYAAGNYGATRNAATVLTNSHNAVPSATTLAIGTAQSTPSELINGHIRKVAYWPRRLSDSLLQQLTT